MKKTLLSLLIMIILLPAFPQQETKKMQIIGKPRNLQSGEMVARRDQNGNYCAAVKVISDMDGFSYDSFDGIVGEILDNPGEDIVYLTRNERVLKIFKSGYEPLQLILSDIGITLKEKEIWQIKIAGDEAADVLPVTFRFTPEDATLFIDGKNAGNELTQSLSVGEHQIRLERDGYQTIEKTISVNDKQVFFQWQMEEQQDAIVEIETTPPGATFYLDGVRLGTTPFSEFYSPGTYHVKITKEGYVTLEDITLEVKAPRTSKTYTLEENFGYLTINTNRQARVFLNGEEVSDPKNVKLAPQLVKIKVTQNKAETLEEQVVIQRNDNISLDLYPEVKTGTLQVAVTPFDAKIELTGDAGEFYTSDGTKIFDDIPVGTYTLTVSSQNYETTTETIVLEQGETEKRSIKLAKPESTVAETKATNLTEDYGIEMVFVKGGTFNMGCTSDQSDCGYDEKPVHEVTLDDFYMGKYEVTQKQWREIMGTTVSEQRDKANKSWSLRGEGDNNPMYYVSWEEVQEFIQKLNQKTGKKYRLPTEAEWEYAARGGSAGSPTAYAGSNNIDEVAWSSNNSGRKTHAVGQKQPNELGIYDMSGNVWEWCSDWYHSDYYSNCPRNNPQGPSSGSYRVLRGGRWSILAVHCRVANRMNLGPDDRLDSGFRLSMDVNF